MLVVASAGTAQAETVAPLSWSWGASQSGNATAEQELDAGNEEPTESRPIDRPSPKLE
jgi:hypothetical protein